MKYHAFLIITLLAAIIPHSCIAAMVPKISDDVALISYGDEKHILATLHNDTFLLHEDGWKTATKKCMHLNRVNICQLSATDFQKLSKRWFDAAKNNVCCDLEMIMNGFNFPINLINCLYPSGGTGLHEAARYNSFNAIQFLLAQNANPNFLDILDNTPLHLLLSQHISSNNWISVAHSIDLLIRAGTDLTVKNSNDVSCIDRLEDDLGIHNKSTEAIEIITKALKDVGYEVLCINGTYFICKVQSAPSSTTPN